MKNKTKMFLATLLIFFSFICIILGVVLQYKKLNYTLDPVNDVTVLAGVDEEVISVTTVDDSDVIDPITDDDIDTTQVPDINSTSDSGLSSGNDSNQNNNIDQNNNKVEQPVVPSAPTIEEVNNHLRINIENQYGISVKYGEETSGYSVGGMSTMIIPDAATCQAALTSLNNVLSLYPTNFFKEISSNGYPLTIYLIKRYSTANVTGVTDSTLSNIVVSIATDYDFTDTFHHEIYHYVEKYIYSKGARYTSWSTLNPSNFVYGNINSSFSYTGTLSDDAFFVNNYAQTDEFEDRASTFEYMMKNDKLNCFNQGKTIWLKAKAMSEQIDYFLYSVSPNVVEYWERFVY